MSRPSRRRHIRADLKAPVGDPVIPRQSDHSIIDKNWYPMPIPEYAAYSDHGRPRMTPGENFGFLVIENFRPSS
jgi:hypothetical protein